MNAAEKCNIIRAFILNRAAEAMIYENWSADFVARQLRDIPEGLREKLGTVDPSELTEEECNRQGFMQWEENSPLRMIPLWLFPFLPDEFSATCVVGKKHVVKKSEMDTDNRFGMLAYGIIPKPV